MQRRLWCHFSSISTTKCLHIKIMRLFNAQHAQGIWQLIGPWESGTQNDSCCQIVNVNRNLEPTIIRLIPCSVLYHIYAIYSMQIVLTFYGHWSQQLITRKHSQTQLFASRCLPFLTTEIIDVSKSSSVLAVTVEVKTATSFNVTLIHQWAFAPIKEAIIVVPYKK